MSLARTALRTVAATLLGAVGLAAAGHVALVSVTRIAPPAIDATGVDPVPARMAVRGGVREVFLQGSPEAIGLAHVRALRERMANNESALWGEYERRVPSWLTRLGLLDWGRWRFRGIGGDLPAARLRELAGEALGFVPDPFAGRMETYQRLLFLHSLYDLSVPLERSPLIGCTTFGLSPGRTASGHPLVGRTFDFEAGQWFDRDKVVFLVREDGAIPFASVGWPGFVGVVTGMNAEGVVVVVHGGRAGAASAEGWPVAFSLRQTLAIAHDTPQAVDALRAQDVLVSHIVFVADAEGRFAVVERAPGTPAFVRGGQADTAVTNHFEGPLAADPANRHVEETTSTLARLSRAEALLAGVAPHAATPETVLAMLRDRRCSADPTCPAGDRRAIDAGIATHGVVADPAARVLWVSAGPHLDGPFVRFDLRELLEAGHDPSGDPEPETLP